MRLAFCIHIIIKGVLDFAVFVCGSNPPEIRAKLLQINMIGSNVLYRCRENYLMKFPIFADNEVIFNILSFEIINSSQLK